MVIERRLLYLMYCSRVGIFTYARLGFRVSVKANGRVEHGLVDSVRNARVILLRILPFKRNRSPPYHG